MNMVSTFTSLKNIMRSAGVLHDPNHSKVAMISANCYFLGVFIFYFISSQRCGFSVFMRKNWLNIPVASISTVVHRWYLHGILALFGIEKTLLNFLKRWIK